MVIVTLMIVMMIIVTSAELETDCDWIGDEQAGHLLCRLEGGHGQAQIVDRQKVNCGILSSVLSLGQAENV